MAEKTGRKKFAEIRHLRTIVQNFSSCIFASQGRHVSAIGKKLVILGWANAQRDGHPAEYRWRPLFNAAKFG